ncbi:MAG: hypothetical protein MUE78_12480, partial [Ilumatobacteraceae bacterium]|nr:hypothetical protein [Ilumatobacteraceae bacterium]
MNDSPTAVNGNRVPSAGVATFLTVSEAGGGRTPPVITVTTAWAESVTSHGVSTHSSCPSGSVGVPVTTTVFWVVTLIGVVHV